MSIEVVFLIIVIGYLGFKEYLWSQERKFMIKTFEEEKRANAVRFDEKVKVWEEKNKATVLAFTEEMNKLQGKYMEQVKDIQQINRNIEPPLTGLAADIQAYFKEQKDIQELMASEKHEGTNGQ